MGSKVEDSRSGSDDCGKTYYSRKTNCLGFQGDAFKGEGHRNIRRQRAH